MKYTKLLIAALFCIMAAGMYAANCTPINVTYLTDGMGNCTTDNSDVWTWDSYNYAKATAYQKNLSPATANLFTPEIDLTGTESVTIQFSHVHRYCGTPSDELTLWVTDDYKGSYAASTWHQLTIDPYASNTAWKPWADVTIEVPTSYVGANTVFAFQYKWTASITGTWEVEKVNITTTCTGGGIAAPVPLPEVGDGRLKVFAQNLRNYYYNLNSGRGNYTQAEFVEKTRKIVDAMMMVDADIFALCEVEAQEIVLKQLADSMNKRVEGEPYVAVADGINETWSEDKDYNIKSGFIYRNDKVKTVGQSYPGTGGNGYYSHTMRIQTFEELATKERFTLSMNHFKAKDSSADQGESTRITNANNLISSLSKYAGDPDILILGDLNCEVGEEPITIIQNAGFEELILKYNSNAYSHCYNGGELIDHAMANASMAAMVTGAGVFHISTSCGSDASKNVNYRYSDHDPYVVAFSLPEKSDECEDIDASFLATGGTGLGEMTAESISGQYYWQYQSLYGAKCQDKGGEDWLITPAYDMLEMKSISIEFEHALNYANVDNISNEQTLWVTADYSSVAGSEWHQLTIPNYPAGTNWTFVKTNVNVPIELVGENTAFAFKYKVANDATNKPTWEIKNLNIKATCNTGTTENVEPTNTGKPKAIKVIENGHIYIIMPDGSVYNAFGQKIQ